MPLSPNLPPIRLRPSAAQPRLALWLALFALLVGALVPTLSSLARPDADDAWSVLCHARGSSPADPAAPHEFGDACALCTLAHTTPVLAAGADAIVVAVAYAPPVPVTAQAPRTRSLQARAPAARGPPIGA
jgi:hypothetical protein